MGIRFQCPNGHPLNVKSYLAGRRGICPECHARFLVPAASDALATPDSKQAKAKQTAATHPPPFATTLESPDSTSLWYIRNEADQQFGPVDSGVIQQWLAEGRVSAHSWVWRTGWPQWLRAGEAFAETGNRPPLLTADGSASDSAPAFVLPPNSAPASTPTSQPLSFTAQSLSLTESDPAPKPDSPSIAHRKRTGQRKKRRVQFTLWLTLAVVLLSVGLLIVVLK